MSSWMMHLEPTGLFGGVCIQGVRGGEGVSSDSFISSPSGGSLVGSGGNGGSILAGSSEGDSGGHGEGGSGGNGGGLLVCSGAGGGVGDLGEGDGDLAVSMVDTGAGGGLFSVVSRLGLGSMRQSLSVDTITFSEVPGGVKVDS